MWPRVGELRAFGFAEPGEFRDHLTALALSGSKVATAGLWKHDYEPESEQIEAVGELQAVLDSNDEPCATVEITRVESHPFAQVPWEFAAAEGEGFVDIEHWRTGHREYYSEIGVDIEDDDHVVCVWFRIVQHPDSVTSSSG